MTWSGCATSTRRSMRPGRRRRHRRSASSGARRSIGVQQAARWSWRNAAKAVRESGKRSVAERDVPGDRDGRQPAASAAHIANSAPSAVLPQARDDRVAAVIDGAFLEPQPARPQRTRAVVVVHGGRIVGERYAAGVNADTPLPGWSMTKSVMNALAGTLVRAGKMALLYPAPIPEWSAADDPRRAITLDPPRFGAPKASMIRSIGPWLRCSRLSVQQPVPADRSSLAFPRAALRQRRPRICRAARRRAAD